MNGTILYVFYKEIYNMSLEDMSITCSKTLYHLNEEIYMVSSGQVGHGLRLQIPDVSPASVAATSEQGCHRCRQKSGICNVRPRPTSSEDTMYIDVGCESLNQDIPHFVLFILILLQMCLNELCIVYKT